MKKGKLITIEGCEGVGKSTLLEMLKKYCGENQTDAVFTREPGGTPIAENIRAVILDTKNKGISSKAETFLYIAAREEHIEKLILPMLNKGKIVFCDRFADSTIAYQGYARGQSIDWLMQLNKPFIDIIHTTIFLDLPPEEGFLRKGGSNKKDRMDSESISFHKKVYSGFLSLQESQPERFVKICAKSNAEEVFGQIISALKRREIL